MKPKAKQFNRKIIVWIVLFIAFVGVSIYYYGHYYTNEFTNKITYNEKSNIDYNVCLKNNTYFADKCLESNKTYVADLIDTINIQYDYVFSANELLNQQYKYNITTEVMAMSKEDSSKVVFDKKENYQDEVSNSNQGNVAEIHQNIPIKYSDYSKLITNFKKDYVLALDAKLIVTMDIQYDGYYDDNFDSIARSKTLTVSIPLSEAMVSITTDSGEKETNNTIYQHINKTAVVKSIFTALIVIDVLILIYIIYMIYKLLPVKREYLKQLDKIMKDYDRAIVNVTSKPDIIGRHVIEVTTFDELLDARDNLEKPILCYQYKKGDKTTFTIINEKEAYVYTLKINEDK